MARRAWVIVATLSWGIWAFALKQAVDRMTPLAAYVAYGCSLLLLVPLSIVLSRAWGLPLRFPAAGTAWAVAAGVFVSIGVVSLLMAMRGGDASPAVALTATYPAITLVLCLLFLDERLSLGRVLGVAAICAGAYLVSRP